MGLGQVLRYREGLARLHPNLRIEAFLVPEQEPGQHAAWDRVCQDVNVTLAWPGAFASRIPVRQPR